MSVAVDSPSFCSPFSQDSAFCWNSHEDLPLSGPEYTQNVLELDIPKHRRQGISIFHQIHYSTDACLSPKIGRQRVFDTYEYTEKEKNKCFNSWDCHKRDLDVLATNPCLTVLDPRVSKWQWWLAVDDTGKQSDDFRLLGAEASHSDTRCIEEAYQQVELPSIDDFIILAQKCKKLEQLGAAEHLHLHIHLVGFESINPALGNHLMQMLIECGNVSAAQQVFLRMAFRDESSWTSLMQGYIEIGQFKQAFYTFQSMQEDGTFPTRHTFLALLKACTGLKDREKGQRLHSQIIEDGFEDDLYLCNSLVVMYVKCGLVDEAESLFEDFIFPDAVPWNALIAGHAEQGNSKEALRLLDKMHMEGIPSNAITCLGILQACGDLKALSKGHAVHADMVKKGHEVDKFLSSSLVDMYAKCGSLLEASSVFNSLSSRGVVLWTALIAGYVEHGYGEEALSCWHRMQSEIVAPNGVTYVLCLKACAKLQALRKGMELHNELIKGAFESDIFVKNTLVDMYFNCGFIDEAQHVFKTSSVQDVVSWNILISGFLEHNFHQDVLDCWEEMQEGNVLPNDNTHVCILKASGSLGFIRRGQEVHMDIIKLGLECQSILGSSLVDFYASCALLPEAQEVFDNLNNQDAVAWNGLIAGYSERGYGEKALSCLLQMGVDGVLPDRATFILSLKACSSTGSIVTGKLAVDSSFASIISLNALLAGYCKFGLYEEAIICAENVHFQKLLPNAVTYVCVLNACANFNAIEKGLLLHSAIVKENVDDAYVACALVDMYAKVGLLEEAQKVFDEFKVRDVVMWSALIAGYALWGLDEVAKSCVQHMQSESVVPNVITWNGVLSSYCEEGKSDRALLVYALMQEQGVLPNGATFLNVLSACSSKSDLKVGKVIHTYIAGLKDEANQDALAVSLIDMYGKCGDMAVAQRVFDDMLEWDLTGWAALAAGYGRQGKAKSVLLLFEKMEEGLQLNGVTFSRVLSACSHAGDVEMGQLYFDFMSRKHHVCPSTEHYVCMIDLLARAGQLEEAVAIVEKMPSVPNFAIWTALLSACRKWSNVPHRREVLESVETSLLEDAANVELGLTFFIPEKG